MIKLSNIYKSYGREVVFKDYSISIPKGKITAIMGPSGSGKTTLLNILAGLIPYKGTVEGMPDVKAYVFQQHNLLPNKTLLENVKFAAPKCENPEEILNLLGLGPYMNKYPSQVSGGQRQRAAVARALAYDAGVILMDEPFSSIDRDLKLQLISEIKAIFTERNITCIIVTHDMEEAKLFANNIVEL